MKKKLPAALKKSLVFNIFIFFLVFFLVQTGSLVSAQNPAAGDNLTNIESLRFRDTDIRTVIRSIAAKAYRDGRRVNIVTTPEVTGLVSIELEDVSWQDALRVVLRAHNYGFEWVGAHMILVGTVDEIAKRMREESLSREAEATVTERFKFNFAKAEDLTDVVRDFLSNRGGVAVDKRTNTMIITDTPSHLEAVRGDIRALDAITPQVLIEAKIVETSFDIEDRKGIDWDFSLTASGAQRPHVWPFDETLKDKHFIERFPFAGGITVLPEKPFTFGTLDATSLSATLELILRDDDTQILSQPKIMTMDNSPANIKVTTGYPVPRYSYSTETGMWEITGFDYIEYGVFLDVTPQINEAGFITLNVEPKVSDVTTSRSFTIGGQTVSIPVIDTRTASTQVMIKDNETLVIGGLVKDKDLKVTKKVPFLGDIPVLGWLFRHRAKVDQKTNLLVFITPRIMTPQTEVTDLSQAEEREE